MAVADIRAVKAMLSHENDLFLRKYGWGPVETLDSATCMKAPATWNETVEKSLVPVKAETRITDVQYVGRSLMKVCKSAFTEHDLLMLSMMSDHMAIKGNVQNEEQLRIARRFALAAQRLTLGTPAYLATLPKLSL